MKRNVPSLICTAALAAVVFLAACDLAPKYQRPVTPTPAAYKESAPQYPGSTNVWKIAQPNDAAQRGKWWEVFTNAELNVLEEQVVVSNQTIAVAIANVQSARAVARQARAQLYPTLAGNPSFTRSRTPFLGGRSGTVSTGSGGGTVTVSPSAFTESQYNLPLNASWEPDLWGKFRDTERAALFEAQATRADLENTLLMVQGEVASDYFQLRSQDALVQLYEDTVKAYRESLDLTRVRYNTGIASDEDVAQAETQLKTSEAQATNLRILRAQLEHAIAVLLGKPPAGFSIPIEPLTISPPVMPLGLPSDLLERRPDIAAAERRVAEANQRIGVAKAAYYPTITLSASGGFESTALDRLLKWSSRFWSIGANASESIFDAGSRRATVEQFRAEYDGTVASYRQTVLGAFQQVEDDLSTLGILVHEVDQQQDAVNSAGRYLSLAQQRYKLGIDSYLNVIAAQTIYLQNRQSLVSLREQQMAGSVQLVEAAGGGWATNQLPTTSQMLSRKPLPPPGAGSQ